MSRGQIAKPPPPPSREITAPKMLADHLSAKEKERKKILAKMFTIQADWVYSNHRLKYIFDKGGEEIYVCLCEDGYNRQAFNQHIRDSFKEVV